MEFDGIFNNRIVIFETVHSVLIINEIKFENIQYTDHYQCSVVIKRLTQQKNVALNFCLFIESTVNDDIQLVFFLNSEPLKGFVLHQSNQVICYKGECPLWIVEIFRFYTLIIYYFIASLIANISVINQLKFLYIASFCF